MVILKGLRVSQTGWSRVKPSLHSHQRGWAIHSNLPERGRLKGRGVCVVYVCVCVCGGGGGGGGGGGCHIFPLSQRILRFRPAILRGILWADQRWAASIQEQCSHHFRESVWRRCVVEFCASFNFSRWKDIFYRPDLLFINLSLYELIPALLLPSTRTCISNKTLLHGGRKKTIN